MKTPVLVLALLLILILTSPLTALSDAGDRALPLSNISASITVDGDPDEWGVFDCTGKAPGLHLETVNGIPQWIWCDPQGDERTDFANPDPRVDLLQFRVTADENYLYGLIIINNMDFNIGDNGATIVAIAINRNGSTTGQVWFSGEPETKVSPDGVWQYQIVVNLADSRYRGQGNTQVTDGLQGNWGGIFYIVDSEWHHKTDVGSMVGADVSNNAVEFKVKWDTIGGVPSGGSFFLRISLITGRGWSNYDENGGGFWDVPDESDALDAVTETGLNTWYEVEDGVVDYNIDLYFEITPPYYPVPEPGLLIGVVTSVSVFAMLLFLKRKK